MKLRTILESSGERREVQGAGRTTIRNPTIMDVERGNMIRIHGQPAHKNFEKYPGQKTWGTIVQDVDFKKQLILVSDYVGGTKQYQEWAHIDDVEQTWNIGGYDKAMDLMDQLGSAVKKNLDKRDELKRDDEIEKQVRFKR